REFYIKAGVVDLHAEEGEIQTALLIPRDSYENTNGFYIKYAMRNAMDIATLGTSVNARLSPDKKTFERVRIAFGVAGPVPLRAETAEAFAAGKPVSEASIEAIAKTVLQDIHPRDSWRASKAFRSHIAVECAARALTQCVKRCGGDV
ncbi:MAG: xanthine dehydrogenase FAD-binding subunit XdhB, partial [Oscillospiraceae bacterium]|nr:xanthine dehydrogenase FAD-binding subunit XdhB [Oscillospiraceae bacterium]